MTGITVLTRRAPVLGPGPSDTKARRTLELADPAGVCAGNLRRRGVKTALGRRIRVSRPGKIPATSVRRRISRREPRAGAA
jgi:hypothetical protein